MYIYLHVHTYLHDYTYLHVYIYAVPENQAFSCFFIDVCTHIYTYVPPVMLSICSRCMIFRAIFFTFLNQPSIYIHTHKCTYTRIHTHTYIPLGHAQYLLSLHDNQSHFLHICFSTSTHTHTSIHTHAYTHIHTYPRIILNVFSRSMIFNAIFFALSFQSFIQCSNKLFSHVRF